MAEAYRIGEAAAFLGVRVETLRRWEREGKLKTRQTSGSIPMVQRFRGEPTSKVRLNQN